MAKRKINKSQKVRDYLAEHPDAGPTAVANALKRYGVSVALVSAIKSKGKTGGRKRRKAKATKRRSVRGWRAAGRRTGRAEPVVAAAELIRVCGGVDEAKAALDAAGRVASVLR
jgi:hypothetical protein